MKKYIGLSFLSLSFFLSPLFLFAQTNQSLPQIYITKINTEKTEVNAGDVISGTITFLNQSTVSASGVKYVIEIAEVEQNGNILNTVGLYGQYVSSDTFALKANETKEIPFSYTVPKVLNSNKVHLRVTSLLDSNQPMGWNEIPITVNNIQKTIEISSIKVVFNNNKSFTAQEGPTVTSKDTLVARISIKNDTKEDLSLTPSIVLNRFMPTGEKVFERKDDSIAIAKGKEKQFDISLPINEVSSGVYSVSIDFLKDGYPITKTAYVRYIVGDSVAKILGVTIVDAGKINVSLVAGVFNIVTKTQPKIGTGTLEVILKDKEGKEVGKGQADLDFDLVKNIDVSVFPAKANVASSIEVVAKKDGQEIARYSTSAEGLKEESLPFQNDFFSFKSLSILVGILLILVISFIFLLKKKRNVGVSLLFILFGLSLFGFGFAHKASAADVYTLQVDVTTVNVGSNIHVTWSAPATRAGKNDSIALYDINTPSGNWSSYLSGAYCYSGGKTSGECDIKVPGTQALGKYEVRYHNDWYYDSGARSPQINVVKNGLGYSLSVDSSTINTGSKINLTWSAPAGRSANYYDWIGLYKVGDTGHAQVFFQCFTHYATNGICSTTVTTPGQYEFIYFFDNSYAESGARSAPINIVKNGLGYSLSVDPSTLNTGSKINLTWSAPQERSANYYDWIGLYKVGDTGNTNQIFSCGFTQYKTNGKCSPTITTPGQYEFKYYFDNSYADSGARSNPINIAASGSGYSLIAATTSTASGPRINLTWSAPAGRSANYYDWIGLYKVGDTGNTNQIFSCGFTQYATSGKCTLSSPITVSGLYEFKYYFDNSYADSGARSNPINAVVGTCGTFPSTSQKYLSMPTNACSFGTPINTSSFNLATHPNNWKWNWNCSGQNGAANSPACSVPHIGPVAEIPNTETPPYFNYGNGAAPLSLNQPSDTLVSSSTFLVSGSAASSVCNNASTQRVFTAYLYDENKAFIKSYTLGSASVGAANAAVTAHGYYSWNPGFAANINIPDTGNTFYLDVRVDDTVTGVLTYTAASQIDGTWIPETYYTNYLWTGKVIRLKRDPVTIVPATASCGSATTTSSVSFPTAGLCGAGNTVSNQVTSTGSGPHTWSCSASGSSVSCQTNRCSTGNKYCSTNDSCIANNSCCGSNSDLSCKVSTEGSCTSNGGGYSSCEKLTCSLPTFTPVVTPTFVSDSSKKCTLTWSNLTSVKTGGTGSCTTGIKCLVDGTEANSGTQISVGTHTLSCGSALAGTSTASVKCKVAPGYGEF